MSLVARFWYAEGLGPPLLCVACSLPFPVEEDLGRIKGVVGGGKFVVEGVREGGEWR